MTSEDKQILLDGGYIVECESPLEIRDKDDSTDFASGTAAFLILQYFKMCRDKNGFPSDDANAWEIPEIELKLSSDWVPESF